MRSAIVDLGNQPIRNYALSPAWWVANTGQIGGTTGTVTTTTEQLRSTATVMKIVDGMGRKVYVNNGFLQAGVRVDWSFWVYCLQPITLNPYWERSGPTYTGGMGGTGIAVPANQWTRITGTLTPTDAQAASGANTGVGFGFLQQGNGAGTTIYVAECVIVRGQPLPSAYVSGDTPGWRWTGTAGASESVGYPYTLESIAGRPAYFAENVPASTSVVFSTTRIGAPLTIFAAQQVPGTASSPGLWDLRQGASDPTRRLLAVTSSVSRFRADVYREDGSASGLYPFASASINPTVKHVTASRLYPGSALFDLFHNGAKGVVTFPPTASPFRSLSAIPLSLRVGSRDNLLQTDVPITYGIALYERELTDNEINRVTAWLARRYGTPIPAGF